MKVSVKTFHGNLQHDFDLGEVSELDVVTRERELMGKLFHMMHEQFKLPYDRLVLFDQTGQSMLLQEDNEFNIDALATCGVLQNHCAFVMKRLPNSSVSSSTAKRAHTFDEVCDKVRKDEHARRKNIRMQPCQARSFGIPQKMLTVMQDSESASAAGKHA